VELLGLSGSYKVLKPAEFRVTNLDMTPNPVKVGDETKITINIENAGDAEDTYTAALVVNGQTEQTQDVRLAGGATQSVSFSTSKDSPGSYSIKIAEQEAILEVVQPVRLDTGIIFEELPTGPSRLRIKNGLDLDVAVALCSHAEPAIPLLAVYVQSGDSYTTMKIGAGTYVLYYAFGQDWVDDSHKFLSNATYHRYKDELEFKGTSRHYTIWTFDFDTAGWVEVYRIEEDEFPVWG
jgi:hypothetical protein